MTDQQDLFTLPVPDREDARILFSILAGRGWQHEPEVLRHLNTYFPHDPWTDRRLREAVEATRGLVVSGPGSPGYCRIDETVRHLALQVAQAQLSQGKKMMRRGIQIRRMAHAYARPDAMVDVPKELLDGRSLS
jgi:hypothetical protein